MGLADFSSARFRDCYGKLMNMAVISNGLGWGEKTGWKSNKHGDPPALFGEVRKFEEFRNLPVDDVHDLVNNPRFRFAKSISINFPLIAEWEIFVKLPWIGSPRGRVQSCRERWKGGPQRKALRGPIGMATTF